MLNSHPLRYSSGSKFFHWTIALIVIGMLSASFFLEDLPKQYAGFAYMIHKSLGLTVLFLMFLRVFWIIKTGKPSLPPTVPRWQVFLARIIQYNLYFFVFLMPICGWIMSVAAGRTPSFFGLFPLPLPGLAPNEFLAEFMGWAHLVIAWIIISLVFLHVAGAVKHYFIDKDGVVQKMLPGKHGF